MSPAALLILAVASAARADVHFSATAAMASPREYPSATLLADGTVLAVGASTGVASR